MTDIMIKQESSLVVLGQVKSLPILGSNFSPENQNIANQPGDGTRALGYVLKAVGRSWNFKIQ